MATYLTVRLIEPKVNFDCLVQTLCEKQASLKEQDPVLLHIDTAAVCSTTLHCYSLQSLLIGVVLLLYEFDANKFIHANRYLT